MTVNRTTLLDLPLPVTGTESGTWGDTTNNGLTQYVDIAVAGMTSLTSANFTAGALTLANTTGDSSATNIAAGSAQYGAIKVSSLATNSTITAPSSNRRYTIINADATYSVTIKASGQTGVVIAAGEKALVAFNGTDYVKIATANGTGEFTTVDTTNLEVTNIKAKDGTAAATIADSTGVVTVTAAPVMTALTASQAVFTTSGKALTSNAITGTGNVVMSASPTLTGTISAAAATLSGNLTLSGGTANGVLYLDGSKVATSGSALTFDGTTFIATGAARVKAVSSGDQIRIEPGTAGSGVSILARNAADNDLTPLLSYGSYQTWYVTGGARAMDLNSTGLGIGTSSPWSQLTVGSGGTANPASTVTFHNTTANEYRLKLTSATYNTNGAWLGLGFGYSDNYLKAAIIAECKDANARTNLHFCLDANSNSANAELADSKMVLTYDGNLGLGVTPSASSVATLEVTRVGSGLSSSALGNTDLSQGAYYNSGWKYSNSTYAASLYQQYRGQHIFYTAASGTAGNAISFTQAMTLDASGNLGIGTSSPSVKLDVLSADNVVGLFKRSTTGEGGIRIGNTTGNFYIGSNGTYVYMDSGTSIPYYFYQGATRSMTLDASGNLMVGVTSGSSKLYVGSDTTSYSVTTTNANASPAGYRMYYGNATPPNNTGNSFLLCDDSATVRLNIRSNGGIANYSANDVNLSDRREKTNFAPAGEYLSKICAIPVQTFNYIDQSEDDPGLTLGVVAQDVQAVAPELVMESNWGTEENPKMRLSIYQTDLQYALMKCIQEQQAIITSLTARVALLEGN